MLCFPISDHVMVPWRNLSFKCHPIHVHPRAYVCIGYEITNGTFPVKASRGTGANWPGYEVEVARARNMSIGEYRQCCVTFEI